MQRHTLSGIALFCGLALVPLLAQGQATIKCWTNEYGIRECGTVMPPEYAAQEHEIHSSQGTMLIDRVEAQKSPEEIAELQRLEAEEKARKDAEKRRLDEGKALLDAYPTESDIELAREGKLASISAAIDVANNQIEFFKKSLVEAENIHKINPSKDVQKHIENLKEQIGKFEGIIVSEEQKKIQTNQEFEVILKKYREYGEFLEKSRSEPASPAAK
jgi:hypothetical protein